MRDATGRGAEFRVESPPGVEALAAAGAFPVIDAERTRRRAYLDSAATTQKPAAVIERVRAFSSESYANVRRGLHRLSEQATAAFEASRAALGRLVGADEPAVEIILCRGATEAINLAAHGWGNKHIGRDDEIVLTTMEHHSNLIPWQLLAARNGARLVEAVPDADGIITAAALERAIGPRTKLVAMTHVSNLLGTINDVKHAAAAAHAAGALFFVDGAQALGHMPVDVREIGCDLYAGSGHKMFGPTGTGFLYGRKEVLEEFEPFLGGGEMIDEVYFDRATFAELPARLEAGTPNIDGSVGLGAAVDFLSGIGMDQVRRHDHALTAAARERLARIPWIEMYGPREPDLRGGLISFNIKGVHSHDVGSVLNLAGVAVRAGHLCAQPVLRFLRRGSCVRASFALYNRMSEVDLLLDGLDKTARSFGVASRKVFFPDYERR